MSLSKAKDPKSKIVILGWYGSDNTGDEAVLQAVLDALRRRGFNDLVVLSTNPEKTTARFEVRSMPRKSLFAAVREMRGSRALILGGGGLLQDGTSVYNMPVYALYVALARLFRLKIVCWGLGAEPFHTLLGKKLVQFICASAHHLTVRDATSKNILIKAGVPPHIITITADPAFLIAPTKNPVSRNKPLAIFCLRHLSDNHPGINLHYLLPVGLRRKLGIGWRPPAERTDRVVQGIARGIRVCVAEFGADVELLPLWPGRDDEMLDQAERAALQLGVPQAAIRRAQVGWQPTEVVAYISAADLLVSMRLHALIFASCQGVPMIALSYARKMRGFMRALNMERWVVEVERRTPPPEELEMKLRLLWPIREQEAARLRQASASAILRAEQDADRIASLL